MSSGNNVKAKLFSDNDLLDIREDISELKMRNREDTIICEMLWEAEAERNSKKKLEEVRKLLSNAKKQVDKAETLLKETICDREEEDQKIEDAILLSDGIRKVREKEEEKKEEEKENEETEG